MIKWIKSLLANKKKQDWYIMPCNDTKAPKVRYYYKGSSLTVNKEDALDRAIYVMNEGISEYRKEQLKNKE